MKKFGLGFLAGFCFVIGMYVSVYLLFFPGIVEAATASGPAEGMKGIGKVICSTPLIGLIAIGSLKLLAIAGFRTAQDMWHEFRRQAY